MYHRVRFRYMTLSAATIAGGCVGSAVGLWCVMPITG